MARVEVSAEEAIRWFEEVYKEEIALGDRSLKRIVFMTAEGAKIYTPAQLLEEMKKGTPIGLKNIEIIREYLKWRREREVVQK